jgi:hypothetical protein
VPSFSSPHRDSRVISTVKCSMVVARNYFIKLPEVL